MRYPLKSLIPPAANIGPNRFHQNRTVSWLMSIPRSARRSSTLRSDSGYFTYIITTRRITSGELLKYRNGCSCPQVVALARKLLVALWKYVTAGIVIEGAVMKAA